MTSNISRWDGNYWSTVGAGLTGMVLELDFYNNELYAGCDNGAAPGNIFKWDGTNWIIVGGGTNAWVSAMAVYNGELYVGGAFDSAGTIAANHIARWNGSNWSPVGMGTNDQVNALIVFNGELYAGGKFSLAGGNSANGIAKWDGNLWTAVGNGTGREVNSFGEYNGELYEGGMGGFGSAEITRWNGTNWVTFDGGVQGGLGSWVSDMIVYNNELYVAGTILYAGTAMFPANGIAKWNGLNWSAVGNGMNNGVAALDTLNGILYAGGYFTNADNNPCRHIASWPDPVSNGLEFDPAYQLLVYPNPAVGELTMTLPTALSTGLFLIRIYDNQGRLVHSESRSTGNGTMNLNLTAFAEGTYQVELIEGMTVLARGQFILY
jgi:hypothetical protein